MLSEYEFFGVSCSCPSCGSRIADADSQCLECSANDLGHSDAAEMRSALIVASRRIAVISVIAAIIFLLAVLATASVNAQSWSSGKSWIVAASADIPGNTQLSGCVWHSGRDTIFAINESNRILELSRDGMVLRTITLYGHPVQADYESITIVAEGLNGSPDTIAIGHEGIGFTIPSTVRARILVIDLDQAATTLDLSTANHLMLPIVACDYEAIAYDPWSLEFQWVRQAASNGVVDLTGNMTVYPRQSGTRGNTKDICINRMLSVNTFYFDDHRWLVERSVSSSGNLFLHRADLIPLIGPGKWEGLTIDDDGSIYVVGEFSSGLVDFKRLDLMP